MLADSLPVYGKVKLMGQTRNSPYSMEFLISRMRDKGILVIAFLAGKNCMLCLDKGVLAW